MNTVLETGPRGCSLRVCPQRLRFAYNVLSAIPIVDAAESLGERSEWVRSVHDFSWIPLNLSLTHNLPSPKLPWKLIEGPFRASGPLSTSMLIWSSSLCTLKCGNFHPKDEGSSSGEFGMAPGISEVFFQMDSDDF